MLASCQTSAKTIQTCQHSSRFPMRAAKWIGRSQPENEAGKTDGGREQAAPRNRLTWWIVRLVDLITGSLKPAISSTQAGLGGKFSVLNYPSEERAKAFAGTFVLEGIEPSDPSTVPNGTGRITSDSRPCGNRRKTRKGDLRGSQSLKHPRIDSTSITHAPSGRSPHRPLPLFRPLFPTAEIEPKRGFA